jgi:hypothetical protein
MPTATPISVPTSLPPSTPIVTFPSSEFVYLLILLAFVVLVIFLWKGSQYLGGVYHQYRKGKIQKQMAAQLEAKEEARWRRFEETVLILLKERHIVCELCLTHLKGRLNIQKGLARYAEYHPEKAAFGAATIGQLRAHLHRFHSSKEWEWGAFLDFDSPVHLIRQPSWQEKARAKWLRKIRAGWEKFLSG